MVGELVDRDAVADQGCHMAAPRGVLLEICDVDGDQSIEMRPAIGQRLPATTTSARGCVIAGAGAEIPSA